MVRRIMNAIPSAGFNNETRRTDDHEDHALSQVAIFNCKSKDAVNWSMADHLVGLPPERPMT
jgi:hypothetical protein